ncbi:hypothetical protein BDW71DRAFT_194303 [Aspergillus fruticulosus]
MPSPNPFVVYNTRFHTILGESPTLELLANNEASPFAHETDAFILERNELFITATTSKIQAHLVASAPKAQLMHTVDYTTLSSEPPYTTTVLIAHFHGRPFNSVNDVRYRPPPQLPNQVYRFDPETGSILVYLTDTDWIHGDGGMDDTRVSPFICAFDLITHNNQPFLANRRVFAMTDSGIPDGIKCDLDGNMYSGCGDGVNLWSPGGKLGRILVDRDVANFCFGRKSKIFLLNG